MSIIRITVSDQDLVCTSKPVIASQGVEEDSVAFLFSSEWDGMGRVATFFNVANKDDIYTSVIDAEGVAVIPWEVTQTEGAFYIGVYGTSGDTIYTSNLLRYTLEKGIYTVGHESEPPSPDIIQQLLAYAGGALAAVADETANRITADAGLSTRIDAVNNRIDETVSVFGVDSVEKTLFTGTARYSGTSYTLVDDASSYTYLDLYINAYGRRAIRTIPVTASRYDVVALNLADYVEGQSTGHNPLIAGAEFQVSVSGTTFTIDNHTYYRYNSSVSGDPVAGQAADAPTSDLTNVAGQIEKIVGRIVAGNTELADIRVGADGVTYDTAGTAVRTQFNDEKLILDTVVNGIEHITENRPIADWKRGYISLPVTGGTVDLSTHTNLTDYISTVVPCQAGDTFSAIIHGGPSYARWRAYLDENNKVLARGDASFNFNGNFTVPSTAGIAKMVINTKIASGDQYLVKNSHRTSDMIANNEAAFIATRNYSIGDYLVVDNVLYKCTAAIASGNSITPGTNATATTVMAEIRNLI